VELQGKTAIVTGAARGIGRVTAECLAREGASVVAADLNEPEGRRVVEAIRAGGGTASFVVADVTRERDVEYLVLEAERRFGSLDILVNNAGGYDEPVFPDASIEHWTHTLDLNLRSVLLGIHFAIKAMAERGGGAVVNIASSAGLGFAPHPGPEYAVAKAGVMRLTACLAPLAERGIRVNCVCPHTVATPNVLQTIEELRREGRELPPTMQGDLLEPEEIADAAVELIRDESLAGRVLVCRGGQPPSLLPQAD
jgi:NAD(P)-dependent dehydrogenase (short-subunit alcohol dehydrogenase family)